MWRKRECENKGSDHQKTPFTPRPHKALHPALVGPTHYSMSQDEIVWCCWIPPVCFSPLCLSRAAMASTSAAARGDWDL